MNKINSNQNPKIKLARSLKSKKNREKTGLFLVEGLHHVGEAFEADANIDFVLITDSTKHNTYLDKLIDKLENKGIKIFSVSNNVYATLSEKENFQSIIAVVHSKQYHLPEIKKINLAVGLISPQDPGNIGTILRTMDAFGGDALFLIDGSADPYHSKCVRASMGTIFWIPIIRINFDDFIKHIQDQNINLYGTSAKGGLDPKNCSFQYPAILLLGSEQKGLSEFHKSQCDEILNIEMRGRVSSLNLSISASIFLNSMKQN